MFCRVLIPLPVKGVVIVLASLLYRPRLGGQLC